jgi:thiol-disulfide isomerase/thioredoxin
MKRLGFLGIFLLLFGVFSCSTDYKILDSVDSISITADNSIKIIGQTIYFTVKTNSGDIITEDATILVNNTPIEGDSFISNSIDTYTVQAKFYGVVSDPITIRFHDGSEINFVKRVLIEDYTGTWCGNCPRVSHAIELARAQSEYIVPVGIHRSSSNPADAAYDPYNYDTSSLEAVLNMAGYPKALLNRMTRWQPLEQNNIPQVINLTQGDNPKLGLSMSNQVTSTNLSLNVNVKFSKDFENLKLVVYVLENGLIYDQVNYTSFYGGLPYINNFEHEHVLRSCLTPLFGEPINSEETKIGNTYSKSFSIPIPSNIANSNNVEFVAFVTGADNKAINVRKANRNENQEFEEF